VEKIGKREKYYSENKSHNNDNRVKNKGEKLGRVRELLINSEKASTFSMLEKMERYSCAYVFQ
jgi:hypothetical protein